MFKLFYVLFFLIYLVFGSMALADNRILYGKYISYAELRILDAELEKKDNIISYLDVALIFGEPMVRLDVEGKMIWMYYFIDAGDGNYYRDIVRYLEFEFDNIDGILQTYDFVY